MADEDGSLSRLVAKAHIQGLEAVKPPRGRILLADDEYTLVRSFARLLELAGYQVEIATNGQEAATRLRTEPFDVIVSDIQMPGLSGLEVLRIAREHNSEIPVILITGDPTVESAVKAVELGALQYLLKPVDSAALLKVVEKAVLLHRMLDAKHEAMKLLNTIEGRASDLAGLTRNFERTLQGLWMAFQPIVCWQSQTIFGYEALLRSVEPSLPHPGAVLRAAECLDRLPELGRCVRKKAAEAFENAPKNDALLFVNLHSRDLLDEELFGQNTPLTKIASRVVLEITERAALDEIKDLRARIAQLRSQGFRIAIDDLGAGYAGLTSFAHLEPEFVKLDMSLIRDIHLSPVKQKLVRSMTSVCKELEIKVVAEGIEIVEERAMSHQLGCDLMQGYLLARPGPPFPTPIFP